MDGRRRAGIHAPGRLRDDEQARMLQDLPADDELLQIAAGKAACLAVGPRLRTSKPSITSWAKPRVRLPWISPRLTSPRRRWALKKRVLGKRHGTDGAMPVALLGHEGGAEGASCAGTQMSHRFAIDQDGVGPFDAGLAAERRHEFVLAVAGDAADAEDLAAGDAEADAP